MIPTAIALLNAKGGVGKTSVVANVAGLAALAGRRVLVIDLDLQGDIRFDLGYGRPQGPSVAQDALGLADVAAMPRDDGRHLYDALTSGGAVPLAPLRNVRRDLDVAVGGAFLEDVVKLPDSFWQRRVSDPRLALYQVLAPIAADYDLILIDSPPATTLLQEMALCAARFVVIPTRSDPASSEGLVKVAEEFELVAEWNPDLELLGVVLFGVNPSARRVQAETRAAVARDLGGVAPVFESTIRYLEVPAKHCRELGVLAHEYEEFVSRQPRFFDAGFEGTTWSKSAPQLAGDYDALAGEILRAQAAALGADPVAAGTA